MGQSAFTGSQRYAYIGGNLVSTRREKRLPSQGKSSLRSCPLPIIPLCLSREEKRKLHGDVQMVLAKKSKKCYRCDEILLAGAVPLCKATRNRELTEKKSSAAGSIVLSDLLRKVGIGVCSAESEESRSACKKSARKIFNCCTMFHELESAVKARIDEGNSESTKGGDSMEIPPADRHRTPRK